MANRLSRESSPYLRQHAENPVDWWPWGDEAFAEARRLNKPVFVSIGYAACHWCHVMAHESFDDADTARVMNDLYINIKVDREERPDVDAVFMTAINVMGEGGGWPLSAFCLPDGRPFFLGTYFPPTPRFGRPSFTEALEAMHDAFRSRRSDAEDNAAQLVDGLARVDAHYRRGARDATANSLTAALLVTAGRQLAERADAKYGGLAGKPKFPSSSTHELLARVARLSFGAPAQVAFDAWAKGMAEGGIYDHIGGGFARYSVDERWLVPHFEKMLYDQAQLFTIYAHVVAQGGPFAARAREVIAETIAFLVRDLSDSAGGLWSSLDADTDDEEGKFYVWTPAELRMQLGAVRALTFGQAYGVTDHGNFENGWSVLARVTPRGTVHEEEDLAESRATLFAVRERRTRPGADDKVLAGWNGLAVTGLVAAWRATQNPDALALALRVATFLRDRMISDGRVARVFHDGVVKSLDGTLDDYAFVSVAFLELAEATGDRTWWDLGAQLVATARAQFVADEDGVLVMYLAAAGDPLLVHRPESHQDGAIPSGSAWLVTALLRLGLVGGDESALKLAETYLVQRLASPVAPSAFANSGLFAVLDDYLHGQTIVITDGPQRDALVTAARTAFAPTARIAGPWASPGIIGEKPSAPDGSARAYVCTGPTCAPPVTTPEALHALLHPVHQ